MKKKKKDFYVIKVWLYGCCSFFKNLFRQNFKHDQDQIFYLANISDCNLKDQIFWLEMVTVKALKTH